MNERDARRFVAGCNPRMFNVDDDEDHVDEDGDGFAADNDCNDQDASINPEAIEVCDGIDNDCDGVTDPSTSEDSSVWYRDADGDGF